MSVEISGYLKSIFNRPAQEVFSAVLPRVNRLIDKGVRICHPSESGMPLSDSEFIGQFRSRQNVFKDMGEILTYLRKRKRPGVFIDCGLREKYQALLGDSAEDIIREADVLCDHTFDLLGSGPQVIKNPYFKSGCQGYIPIDWHADFKTGYRWSPQKYYKDIEIPLGKADVKVPWELSRFQHLSRLGQAYLITGNEKYAEECINQISDWIDNNPPERGVNWACTMDVAIRVANWLVGYYFFKDSKKVTERFLAAFLKSLLVHGRHIMNNLENKTDAVNNHYLSNIVGLLYLGVIFPEFTEAERWLDMGFRELKSSMQEQVLPDGCDFEGSTCYHRLVLELFFYPTMLLIINNPGFNGENFRELCVKIFGRGYAEKLYKMFEVVLHILKPNGTMPQVGDNDNGRLHIFTGYETTDMRYLLVLGAIFFTEPKFKIKEFDFSQEALWVFGEKGFKTWEKLEKNQLADIGCSALYDGGWYIMRNNKDYMIISSGLNGLNGIGGHNHNDKLSFEVCVNSEEIFIDPGTYVYAPEPKMRNLFRSTMFHNTVVIDRMEQNRFDERSLFKLRNDSNAHCVTWEDSFEESLFIGEHDGYKRLRDPVRHRRTVRFFKHQTRWVIKDEFCRSSGRPASNINHKCLKHLFSWYFHLAPHVCLKDLREGVIVFKGEKNTVNLAIRNVPAGLTALTEEGCFSSAYGKKIPSTILKLECRQVIPFDVEFEIGCDLCS